MWFSLFGIILVLCIAFFQGLQGLFSAIIMCVLTVLCAAAAFGTYENLYYGFLIDRMPQHGEAVGLLAIFILSLLVLRTVCDNLIKGNMQFPVWVDRIGGGLFGLVAALIIVGMLQIGFQLLPFNDTFLGFNRFVAVDRQKGREVDEDGLKKLAPENAEWRRQSLRFNPDGFTVALVSRLSRGSLNVGGRPAFTDVHPDYLAGLQNSRAGVQRESLRTVTNPDALTVYTKGYRVLSAGSLVRPNTRMDSAGNTSVIEERVPGPPAGSEWRAYRVFLGEECRDPDGLIRFRAPQVRIVGREAPDAPPREFVLKAVPSKTDPRKYLELYRQPLLNQSEHADVIREGKTNNTPLDFVFEVPKGFRAEFIEFKRTARVDVSTVRELPRNEGWDEGRPRPGRRPEPSGRESPAEPTPPPGERDSAEQRGEPLPHERESPDRVSGVWIARRPQFYTHLPLKLTSNPPGAEIQNQKFMGGQIVTQVRPENIGADESERLAFDVPGGQALLFVPLNELDPQSFLGKARGFAQRKLPTVSLKTDDGRELKPVGRYAFVNINGQWWFECRYLDETARDADRDLPEFEKIKHADLVQPNTEYVYLFLVPSGARPVELVRAGSPSIDLRRYNLTAP